MNLHRIDLTTLSLFVLVARSGSISKGADLAHLAIGAASKRLSELEGSVGTLLMERHSRGIVLTPAGIALRGHALRILADIDHLSQDLSACATGSAGLVRLWANTSAVTEFLPVDLASFSQANPGVRIEMEERDSQDVALAVLEGRADIGIFADRTPTLGLQTLDYRPDRLVLIVSKGHALALRESTTLNEITAYDFVGLSGATSLAKRLHAEAERQGRRLQVRIQVRSFDAVCQMVAAGLGVAVLPEISVQPHLRSMAIQCLTLDEPWADRMLLLGARDFDGLSRPAQLLKAHLCSAALALSR